MAKKADKRKDIKQSKINVWKPRDDSEIFVDRNGKLFECYFEKVFITDKDITKYNRFFINKSSYENQLDHIVSYINFFINFYDRDMEVMTAYLKFASEIGKERTYDNEGIEGFIDLIYEILFTPTVIDKIRQLTEDNYKDDIESSSDDKKHYMKSEKKHLESLEFTNQHIKVLLCISMAIKIMCPVMLHFTKINQIPIGKNTDTIFRFYKKLFTIFGYGTDYSVKDEDGNILVEEVPYDQVMEHVRLGSLVRVPDEYTHRYYFIEDGKKLYYTPIKINIYNKLYIYCKAKVLESNATNSPIFAQREITGIDVFSVIESFTRRVLITENIVKYRFNDNIVGFNKTMRTIVVYKPL